MSNLISQIKTRNFLLFSVLIAVFVFVRLIYLDSDAPPFKLMNFASIDEFYYSMAAFNLFHFGSFVNTTIPFTELDASPLMLVLNFFTTISLKLFGNNYFGLRFGSGLCSLALFLFIISTIKKTSTFYNTNLADNNRLLAVVLLLLFFAIDYSFLETGRMAEPGIARSLTMVVLIWFIATRESMLKNKPLLFSFVLGFLALFSVCFGYLYNIFFVGAAGLSLLLICMKDHLSFQLILARIFMFGCGAVLCCLLFEACIQVFFHKSFLDYLETLTHFSETRVNKSDHGIMSIVANVKQLFLTNFGTNMFRLNFGFLVLTLVMIPVFFYRTFTTKRNVDIFISCLFIFWLAQSFFENSYPLKRHTIMFPLFFLVIIYAFEDVVSFLSFLKGKILAKALVACYLLIIFCLIYSVSGKFFRSCITEFPDLKTFFYVNATCCLIMFFMVCVVSYIKKNNLKTICMAAIILMVPSLFMLFNKIILNPTYRYKNAMVDIGEHAEDKVVVGGVSYGFRLYNSSKPALNVYTYVYSDKPEYKRRFIKLLDIGEYFTMCPPAKKADANATASPINIDYLKEISKETGVLFKFVKLYDLGDRHVLLVKKI